MSVCAIPGCTRPAKDHQIMCWPLWCRVPKVINRAIFATYRSGKGVDYDQHVADAVAAVVAKEAAEPSKAVCIIPNCRKSAPAGEPFCAAHR